MIGDNLRVGPDEGNEYNWKRDKNVEKESPWREN